MPARPALLRVSSGEFSDLLLGESAAERAIGVGAKKADSESYKL